MSGYTQPTDYSQPTYSVEENYYVAGGDVVNGRAERMIPVVPPPQARRSENRTSHGNERWSQPPPNTTRPMVPVHSASYTVPEQVDSSMTGLGDGMGDGTTVTPSGGYGSETDEARATRLKLWVEQQRVAGLAQSEGVAASAYASRHSPSIPDPRNSTSESRNTPTLPSRGSKRKERPNSPLSPPRNRRSIPETRHKPRNESNPISSASGRAYHQPAQPPLAQNAPPQRVYYEDEADFSYRPVNLSTVYDQNGNRLWVPDPEYDAQQDQVSSDGLPSDMQVDRGGGPSYGQSAYPWA